MGRGAKLVKEVPLGGATHFPEPRPLVTVARDGNRWVLATVDAAASGLGLCVGMKLARAKAMVADLLVHEHDPEGDTAALVRLAGWCLRYAPLVAADPPDGLWIDVTGGTHLQGGETPLLRDLVRRLASPRPLDQGPTRQGVTYEGLAARAAVADTPAVAHAVARFGDQTINVVPPGAAALTDLPIEALRLPAEVAASLRLMGFDRVGPLAAAPRAPLVRRFGTRLATRLDQASGKLFEPIVPIAPPGLIQARLGFVEPLLTVEAFSTMITRLTALVCADMERAGSGARRLDLLFERVDGTVQAICAASVRPVRNARHWGRMLHEHLERLDPGLGVEAMRLVATATEPLGFAQSSARLAPADAETGPPDIAPLVDRLISRLGRARVYGIVPTESDVPERSVRRVPALLVSARQGWPADLPRPIRLLDPPQPVDAMALLPDYPPLAFTWRRLRHRIRQADGPERIVGEWWKRDGEMRSVRDYFRVEDEGGRRFWLFRRGNGSNRETGDMRWFLHGFF